MANLEPAPPDWGDIRPIDWWIVQKWDEQLGGAMLTGTQRPSSLGIGVAEVSRRFSEPVLREAFEEVCALLGTIHRYPRPPDFARICKRLAAEEAREAERIRQARLTPEEREKQERAIRMIDEKRAKENSPFPVGSIARWSNWSRSIHPAEHMVIADDQNGGPRVIVWTVTRKGWELCTARVTRLRRVWLRKEQQIRRAMLAYNPPAEARELIESGLKKKSENALDKPLVTEDNAPRNRDEGKASS